MNVYQNITQLVGKTPVVHLRRIVPEGAADVFVKLEMFNPSGSVKDRAAYNLIAVAEEQGLIQPGDTIIEPTSGNTGIGLAMNAAAKGYKAIFVMPDNMSKERINNPVILLADEPTGALDTKTSIEIMDIFQRLNNEGKTVILVTHEPEIAEYAKRVVRFRDGQIVASEPVVQRRIASEEVQTG